MSEEETPRASGPAAKTAAAETAAASQNLAYEQARLAYSIIQTLLEHTRVTGDLVALMARAIDEDTLKALTNTPHWAAYLDSRRAMERTRGDVERFAAEWTRMSAEIDPPTTPPHTSQKSEG